MQEDMDLSPIRATFTNVLIIMAMEDELQEFTSR